MTSAIVSGVPATITLAKPYASNNTYSVTASPSNAITGATGSFTVYPLTSNTFSIDSEGYVSKSYFFQTIGY